MSLATALIAEIRADPQALEDLRGLLAPMMKTPVSAQYDPGGWLDTKGAASYLGISPNALHKHTSARTIAFHQDVPCGRCWFKRSDLDSWRSGR
jgi:hypothetical protein